MIVGGLLAAVLLRACIIEAYRIPSNSMERTLLVGDFVLVSKLAYGPRIAGTRLPGLGRVECGDVVVFHHPPARGAVEDRPPYIKRVVGLPGQTVVIRAKHVVVDGRPVAPPPQSLSLYDLTVDESFTVEAAGLEGSVQRAARNRYVVAATPEEGWRLADDPGAVSAEPFLQRGSGTTFPRGRRWSLDDYGPLRVPQAGWTVPLDEAVATDYRLTMERFEGVVLDRVGGAWRLDGVPADSFTFRQNYLFVLGDNRDDSADSRVWGFVPMSHVIGRAAFVYFSVDEPVPLPGMPPSGRGAVRWDRIGTPVERSCEPSGRS